MVNFVLIALCIIAGMWFRSAKLLPEDAHKGINAFIIYLALPSVSFKYLPHVHWSEELLFPAIAPVLVWLGALLCINIYAAKTRINKATKGGLKLVSGLCNTSFVGFPLITAYFTEKELSIAIICDQVSFVVLSTLGVITAVKSSQNQSLSAGLVFNRVIRFPPFWGCIGALTIPRLIDISAINPLFDKLAATVGPLALFSIGLQLQFSGWQSEVKPILVSAIYKLLIAPAAIMLIAVVLGLKGMIPKITVFEMAMSTMLTAGVVADEYGLNPRLSNLIIGVSILVGFITTAFWYWIIQILS